MNDSWKEPFKPWILERGKTYHQMGRVHQLKHRGKEVTARVDGTELYHVAIRFDGGIPVSAACDCPNAADGYLCKHTAAVLFALEDLEYKPEHESDNPTWEDALEALPVDTLRVVLRNQAEQNPELQNLLLRLYDFLTDEQHHP